MHIKFLVLFVTSVALWQVAKGYAVKPEETMANATQAVRVVFNYVNSSSTKIFGDNIKLTSQSDEDEKNKTSNVTNNDANLNVEIYEEMSVSLTDLQDELRPSVHVGKDVDNVKSNVEDDEKEEKNEKVQTLCGDENEKLCRDKQAEEEEAEGEDDEATNKDGHENDD